MAQDDYQFEIWAEDGTAFISFEECLTWRGEVRATEPSDDVYRTLMTSDAVTEFLDEWDCSSVKRATQTPSQAYVSIAEWLGLLTAFHQSVKLWTSHSAIEKACRHLRQS
jgi:hypothetical protein